MCTEIKNFIRLEFESWKIILRFFFFLTFFFAFLPLFIFFLIPFLDSLPGVRTRVRLRVDLPMRADKEKWRGQKKLHDNILEKGKLEHFSFYSNTC